MCFFWVHPRAAVENTVVPQRGHGQRPRRLLRNHLPQTRLRLTCPLDTVLRTSWLQKGHVYLQSGRVTRGVVALTDASGACVSSRWVALSPSGMRHAWLLPRAASGSACGLPPRARSSVPGQDAFVASRACRLRSCGPQAGCNRCKAAFHVGAAAASTR